MKERRQSGAFFDWVDGMPIPRYAEPITKASATALIAAAASVQYVPPADRNPDRFKDMTTLEVAAVRLAEGAADGDMDNVKEIFDRILGKPKQETQNVTVSVTYQDYLNQLIEEEKQSIAPNTVTVSISQIDDNLDGI